MRRLHFSCLSLTGFIGGSLAVIFSVTGTQSSYALSLNDIVTNPVGAATSVLAPSSSNAATNPTSSTLQQSTAPQSSAASTPASTDATSEQPTASSDDSTKSVQESTPTATRTQAVSPTANDTTSDVSFGDQSISDTPAVIYGSGRISSQTADMLYRIAAAAGLVGLIMYAVTIIPLRRGRTPTEHRHTRLKVKAGH